MGLLEILDHRLCGATQDEPLNLGPGQSRFLSDDFDVSATIVPWQPIWLCAVAPKADSLPELHANYLNRSVDSHRIHCPQQELGTIWEQ